MPHTAHKVPVAGGKGPFSFRQDPHMSAKTGAATGRADNSPRIKERLDDTLLYGVFINQRRTGNNDKSDSPCRLLSLQKIGSIPQIFQTSVGARP